jgi:lipoprotein LprG
MSRFTIAGRAASSVAGVVFAVVVALAVVGCGSSAPKASAQTLLQKSKATADAATSVHFELTSSGVPQSGTNLVNGRGDLVRPSSLQGTFGVAISGFTANIKVVSVGDTFMAELPFTGHYVKTNPSNFGLKNPAELLDPQTGLSSLLTVAQSPQLGPTVRVNGELLQTVSFTVPGDKVPILPDVDPSKPVQVTVAINPQNYELRRVTLVGPFISSTSNSTYVVTLTNYNEHVTITLPS